MKLYNNSKKQNDWLNLSFPTNFILNLNTLKPYKYWSNKLCIFAIIIISEIVVKNQ